MGISISTVSIVLIAAQIMHASIAGIVRDAESGAALAGATVSLSDIERAATTDAEGRYSLTDVLPGPQHIVVRRIGYAPQTFHALVPPDGVVEIGVALERAPIEIGAIDVSAPVAVRGLDDGDSAIDSDRAVSQAAIRNHPLASEPDAFRASGGGEVAIAAESPSGIHIRGGSSDQVTYLLDGIPVFSPYHSSGTFSAWNPDALSRLDLFTSSARVEFPDALSGAVTGTTRAPRAEHSAQGSASSAQARATFDGPLGESGAGYLASVRSAFPGLVPRRKEASHIGGESTDWIVKVESPFAGGRARVLDYGTVNEIHAAAIAGPEGASDVDRSRNELAWDSRSIGVGWTRRVAAVVFDARVWSARARAGATWTGADSLTDELAARRRDEGAVVSAEHRGANTRTVGGLRAQRSHTSYALAPLSGEGRSLALDVRAPVSAAFVQHARPVTARSTIDVALTGAWAARDLYAAPSAKLTWKATQTLTLSGAYARRHQFAQSLRNPESTVDNIFPADLYIGAGAGGVPVAKSHVGIIALDHRMTAGMRVGVQAYARDFDALALVAPLDSDPFTASGYVSGTGVARGATLEFAANDAHYAILASYAYQDLRLTYADTTYVPAHGARHSIEGGIIVFPSSTSDIRLGFESALGRRGTAGLGFIEWEACNLLDQGCEFVGGGTERAEPLGATRLPGYFRMDLSVRKHWHVHAAGRDAQLGVFGTVTNLFNRQNVLTVAINPDTGERTRVEMRPRSPLVVGIDWRF
ncbi:MAG: carboxypeptidase regulatory-like domain-containing protein [bacterium]